MHLVVGFDRLVRAPPTTPEQSSAGCHPMQVGKAGGQLSRIWLRRSMLSCIRVRKRMATWLIS